MSPPVHDAKLAQLLARASPGSASSTAKPRADNRGDPIPAWAHE